MSIIDSLRVLGAMGRVTAPTLVDIVRRSLHRETASPGSVGARSAALTARSKIDERTHWFGRRVIELLQIDLTATGADRVPTDRAYVYMSNHQSHLDIPVLYATLPSPTIRMLAKKELFEIPLWGRGLRAAEFVEVDRGNHARAMESIDYAARLIRDGVSIYLAPEGTRSKTGAIGRLKKGGFRLAHATGTPIVPVAIRGTIDILPPGAKVMRTGQRVEVTIGSPIEVEGREIADLVAEVSAFFKLHIEKT